MSRMSLSNGSASGINLNSTSRYVDYSTYNDCRTEVRIAKVRRTKVRTQKFVRKYT